MARKNEWYSANERTKRRQELLKIGVDPSTATKARDWGKERFQKFYTQQRETNRRESLLNDFEVTQKKRDRFLDLAPKEFNKAIKKEEQNYYQRQRYKILKKQGLTTEQAKKGSASENAFDVISDKFLPFEPLLYIYWKEKSEYDDPAFVHRIIRESRGKSPQFLIDEINHWKGEQFGLIGQARAIVIRSRREKKRVEQKFAGWHLVYNHKGMQYTPLLAVVRAVMVSVYDDAEKEKDHRG